jgi:hypothetical protein
MSTIGYSDFHNLMGFTSKKMQIIFLKMFDKMFFNWLNRFLRICI